MKPKSTMIQKTKNLQNKRQSFFTRHGRSKKLEASWTEPYRVVEKISDVN